MQIKKKVLAGLIVIGLLALTMGFGTYAYYQDEGTSEDNAFTSGTVNLQLRDGDEDWADIVYTTWQSPSNWAPNDEVTATLDIRNDGTIPVEWLYIKPLNLLYGGGTGGVNLADMVNITKFHAWDSYANDYDIDPDWIATWGAWGSTAPWTLTEFAGGDNWFIFEPGDFYELDGGNMVHLEMTFAFDFTAGNEYQGAWCQFDLGIAITQGPPAYFVHMGTPCGYGEL